MLIPATVPDNYDIRFHPGRQQPFTVWHLRPARKHSVVAVRETFAFCETWTQALGRIAHDEPDVDIET